MYNSRAFLSYFPYTYLHSTYLHIHMYYNEFQFGIHMHYVDYSTQQQSTLFRRIIEEYLLLGGICTINVVLRGSTQSRYFDFYMQEGSKFLGGAACTALKIQFLVFPITKHKFLRSIHSVEISWFLSLNAHFWCIIYFKFIITKTNV